jgi:hypothetical protein
MGSRPYFRGYSLAMDDAKILCFKAWRLPPIAHINLYSHYAYHS